MVRINYVENPLRLRDRVVHNVDYTPTWTVRDYLRKVDLPVKDVNVFILGRRVTVSDHVRANDEILVTSEIHGPALGALIWKGIVALGAAMWAHPFMSTFLVASVIYSVASGMKKPSLPAYGLGNDLTEGSPTYGWDGIITTQDVGRPIPIVYGEHAVGGNIINSFVSYDGDQSYLNVLLALCEGEVDAVSNIKINDQPIANFAGCSYAVRYGTNDQSVIPGFEDLHDTNSVNAELTQNNAYTYTTVGTDITGFEVLLRLPSGLYFQGDDGILKAWFVTYKVEYKLHTDGDWTDLGETTISAKSRSVVRRYYAKTGLAAGQYDIRVTRTSVDSDFTHEGTLYLHSIDEITTEDLAYPNTALIGFKLLASEQLSGSIPNFNITVTGKKVSQPQIMNGATEVDADAYYWDPDDAEWKLISDDTVLSWDGVSYVTKWSPNPAWCFKDLMTSTRYGLGEYIDSTDLDDDDYLELAKWYQELVPDGNSGDELRMMLDVVLDASTRAPDAISQLAASVRALSFYSSGTIKIRADKPEDPAQLFGMGNIIDGSFQRSWRSKKDQPNVVEVQYADQEKNYTQERIAYLDEASVAAGDPIRKRTIQMFCTRVSQALREARYLLLSSKYADESISFKAMIDSITLQAGDVIGISHDIPQWGYSGVVQSGSTTTLVKLDRSVVIEAGSTYKIQVRLANDTIEERTVSDTAGTYTQLNVTAAFSSAPAAFDKYAVGKENVVVKPFRVVSMKRLSSHDCEISAVEHNANVYDDTAVVIPDDNYSALDASIPDVEELTLGESVIKLADGTIEDSIDVSWLTPNNSLYPVHQFTKARVYLSDDDGDSWELRGETTSPFFQIVGGIVDSVTYTVAVVSVDQHGMANPVSESPQETITVVGKSAAPSDVETLAVAFSVDHIRLSWPEVTDVDFYCYEIRQLPFSGASWDLGTVIATGVTELEKDLFTFTAGVKYYAIKAVDTTGNYSANAATASISISSVPDTNIVDTFDEDLLAGTVSDDAEIVWGKWYSDAYYRQAVALRSDRLWDAGETWDAGNTWDTPHDTSSYGTYITTTHDLGAVLSVGITLDVGLANVQGGALGIEIAYSDDDDEPTNWTDFVAGQYSARYIRFRLTLSTTDPDYGVVLYKFKAIFDVPDITQEGTNVSVAGSGWTTISLTGFTSIKTVIVSVNGGAYVVETDESALPASFNVKLKDPASSMAQVAGAINYFVKGY